MKATRVPDPAPETDPLLPDDGEDRMTGHEVRRRALAGAAVDLMRGIGVRFVGLVGMLVLARMLTPHDLGLIAFGATFVTFANYLADGGIGTALIRRAEPPERADLKALLAFQIGINTAFAAVVIAVLLPFGELGQVTALMVLALPLTAVRAPGVILSERQLDYRPLALVEIVETVAYYVWAVATVFSGWGVWGLATGNVVRAVVGSVVLLLLLPASRLVPVPSWTRVRRMLGFGFRFQAVGVANLVRDQGINATIAIVAGVSVLGLWSVAFRILQIPLLFLNSLWRVSFPGMSRLVSEREDLAPTIERVLAVVAVVSGVILAPLVAASAPLITVLLGDQWVDAATVIPPASLHLMIVGPISVALVGYLWAIGDASSVLRATLVGLPLIALVLVGLLPVIGVAAVGFAWLAGGIPELIVLIRAARRRVDVAVTPLLAPPVLSAVLAALVGWIGAAELGSTFLAAVVGATLAWLVYFLALAAWSRRQLLDTIRLVSRGMRGALSPGQ